MDPAEAENVLEHEMKMLESEISTQRDRLRRATTKLEEAMGSSRMEGMELEGVSSTEIKNILQRTDPSKV